MTHKKTDEGYPIFRSYLEEENDKPYYSMNTLSFYYEDMERKQKLIEDLAKAIAGYDQTLTGNLQAIEQQVAERFEQWDEKLKTFDGSVMDLLQEWVDDGTMDHIVDSSIVDRKLEPLTAQLAEKATKEELSEVDSKVSDFNARVDEIITTPAEGITQEEIVDARQGAVSLGANLSSVKTTVAGVDSKVVAIDKRTDAVYRANGFYAKSEGKQNVFELPGGAADDTAIQFSVSGETIKASTVEHMEITSIQSKNIKGVPITSKNFVPPLTLRGINAYSDVLRSDGSVSRKIGVYKLDGSQNLSFSSTQYPGARRIFVSNTNLGALYPANSIASLSAVSNFGDPVPVTADANKHGKFYIYNSGGESLLVALGEEETGIPSTATIQAYKDYLTANPITIFYVLAETNYKKETVELPTFFSASHGKFEVVANRAPVTEIEYMQKAIEAAVKHKANLFDGNYTLGKIISSNTDVNIIYTQVGKENDYVSAIIPVKPLKHTIVVEGSIDSFVVGFTNGTERGAAIQRVHTSLQNAGREVLTVNNTGGYDYLMITVSVIGSKPRLFVTEGEEALDAPAVEIGGNRLIVQETVPAFDRYSIYYESAELSPYLPSLHTEVYDWYDEVMENTDGYLTSAVLGLDGQGNELKGYVASTGEVINAFGLRKPRIGITTGIHGEEKAQVVGLFNFMKSLALNESENEMMDKIRSNIDFYIIPVGNPSGFDLNIRNNANGVNLNRNFDFTWAANTEPDKGASAASEPETQIIQNWMQANAFEQYFDFHRADMGADNDQLSWFVANYEGEEGLEMRKEYFRVMATLSPLWSRKYEQLPDNTVFGYINQYSVYPQSWQYAASLGMKSALLEVSQSFRYFGNHYDKTRLRNAWAADVVGNYIFEIAKRYI